MYSFEFAFGCYFFFLSFFFAWMLLLLLLLLLVVLVIVVGSALFHRHQILKEAFMSEISPLLTAYASKKFPKFINLFSVVIISTNIESISCDNYAELSIECIVYSRWLVYWFICLNQWTKKSVERKWNKRAYVCECVCKCLVKCSRRIPNKCHRNGQMLLPSTHMTPSNFLQTYRFWTLCVRSSVFFFSSFFFLFFVFFDQGWFSIFEGKTASYFSMVLLILCGFFFAWIATASVFNNAHYHHSAFRLVNAYNCMRHVNGVEKKVQK